MKHLILTLIVLSLSSVSLARGKGGKRMGELLDQIELTSSQKSQLNTSREKLEKEIQAIRDQIKPKKKEMRKLMKSGVDQNESAIRAKHKEIRELKGKIKDLRFENRLVVQKMLTDDQRKQLRKLRKSMKGKKEGLEE